jgi:hypothetical protein
MPTSFFKARHERFEDFVKLHEGSDDPQDNKNYPRSLDSSIPQFVS